MLDEKTELKSLVTVPSTVTRIQIPNAKEGLECFPGSITQVKDSFTSVLDTGVKFHSDVIDTGETL